jgi:hypothetical protein
VLCNIQIAKKEEVILAKRERFIETKAKSELYLNTNFFSMTEITPGKSIKCYANGQSDISNFTKDQGDLLKKMKLWYIFHSDNKKRPFIMGLPLSERMTEIVKELSKMSQYISISMASFLILYKKNKKHMTS